MGYRFTLEDANIVANLTCGRVKACCKAICSSKDRYNSFLEFLNNVIRNMYSDRQGEIEECVNEVRDELYEIRHRNNRELYSAGEREKVVLKELRKLSKVFDKCPVKSLLLPSFEDRGIDRSGRYMTEEKTMKQLMKYHQGTSCLILQPKENPEGNSLTVFDAFPHFDVALRHIDQWPAVMFWNKEGDFAFVPISNKDELIEVYGALHDRRNSIIQLQEYIKETRGVESDYYYFHLSDLHFGAKGVKNKELKELIEKQVATLGDKRKFEFIITGDAVDSPNNKNRDKYTEFVDFLETRSGKEPIWVLGNHDIDDFGLALSPKNRELINHTSGYPRIEVNKEAKIAFLLFNSNVNGNWAQGEIGKDQMDKMKSKLEKISGLRNYRLVAVLHHHLVSIDTPEFYKDPWYKKFLSEKFLDKTLRLNDADMFIEWLNEHKVKIVLHGHKHIPAFLKQDGINIIACGSSTSKLEHADPEKMYLSYNLLRFSEKEVVCLQYAKEDKNEGEKNIRIDMIRY